MHMDICCLRNLTWACITLINCKSCDQMSSRMEFGVNSWVSFDLPAQLKRTLSALLQAAGAGCQSLLHIEIEGRDVRDPRPCKMY